LQVRPPRPCQSDMHTPRLDPMRTFLCDEAVNWCGQSGHVSASLEPPLGHPLGALYTDLLPMCRFSFSGVYQQDGRLARSQLPSERLQCVPRFSTSANIALIDGHVVAFIKLNHAIAGVYMCVCLHTQESTCADINLPRRPAGKRSSLPALNWTFCEENDRTGGQYG
jgi:prepilin-type processing-associated H-X9-DG protein